MLSSSSEQQQFVVFGTIDGNIRIFDNHQELKILETKGGAIQTLLLHNVSKLSKNPEIIVGDSDGNVFIFSDFQILSKQSLGNPITQIVVDVDLANNSHIVVGDRAGTLTAFGMHTENIFRVRIPDDKSIKSILAQSPLLQQISGASLDPSITCLHVATITDRFGMSSSYLLVADGTHLLHFFSQGVRVHSVVLNANVTQICSGHFEDDKSLQILVGCDDGIIYLIDQLFFVRKYINVGYGITKLEKLRLSTTTNPAPGGAVDEAAAVDAEEYPSKNNLDYLICVGHFNSLKIYYKEQLIIDYQTVSWIHTVDIHQHSNKIMIGLLDNHVIALKINTFTNFPPSSKTNYY